MSRLMVKNLPAYVTPERLREHFTRADGPGGTLTDVKLARKPDGTSRRFGFIGFKSDAEAAAARGWFDRTFVDSARISVSVVDGVKDAPAPRPNKRPRLGLSPAEKPSTQAHNDRSTVKVKPKAPAAVETTKTKKAAQLDEFMEVMQPRTKKGPSWANEPAEPALAPESKRDKKSKTRTPTSAEVQPEEVAVSPDDDRGEGMSDLDWMKRRMSKAAEAGEDDDARAFVQSDDEAVDDDKPEPQGETPPEEFDSVKATILETSRLFVRNLAFSCTEAELLEHFQPHGEVIQVHIPLDALTKTPKGVAFVRFKDPTCALSAFEVLDKTSFQGRLLHILAAVDRKGKVSKEDAEGRKKSVKDERNANRKATATREFNWSMLYMNSDAVASSIADRMNISKADILNPDSDNAAVKLALAETHVIQETKTYLASHGVDLQTLTARGPRSDTALLVKNIPYGTGADGVRELFEPHGLLGRVLVPPAGTIAIVEFVRADEAAAAFRAVAYRRLGNAVVYLEKAPAGILSGAPVSAEPAPAAAAAAEGNEGALAEEDIPLSAGSTLFVKNLSFATASDRLAQAFRHLPGFAFARVQTRPDPRDPASSARVSAGYGFAGFRDADTANRALKGMQGYVLDGHALAIKFAGRGAEEESGKGGAEGRAKARSTKMIVKNVPFEATKKDIRDLFGAHGQLKSVRVPKKFDHRSRGFAFLEFLTRQEAENAYEALKHTHLLGRHLVLEWAAEGEQDLDALRQKAGVGYGGGKELPGRKRKLQMDGEDDEVEEDV